MQIILDRIARLGGLARTSELLQAGIDDELIRMAARYRRIIDAGHGWWALPETPSRVVTARRAGGRLACTSALRFHGFLPEQASADIEAVHVSLARSARKPTHPGLVLHWSRAILPGDRCAVSVEVAVQQAARCRALNAAGNLDG
jgi:hypothetical protein